MALYQSTLREQWLPEEYQEELQVKRWTASKLSSIAGCMQNDIYQGWEHYHGNMKLFYHQQAVKGGCFSHNNQQQNETHWIVAHEMFDVEDRGRRTFFEDLNNNDGDDRSSTSHDR